MTEIKKDTIVKHSTVLKEVYLTLFNERKVTTQADFAEKIKFGTTPVSQMIAGKKPMPLRLLKILYKKYGINSNYIVSDGKDGPMYLKDIITTVAPSESDDQLRSKSTEEMLKKENEYLKKEIRDKEKIIKLLEKGKP